MRFREVSLETPLPGYDALRAPERQHPSPLLIPRDEEVYFRKRRQFGHLANQHYREYMQLGKQYLSPTAAPHLERLAAELEKEQLPEFLAASGWAFAESAMVDRDAPFKKRMARLDEAELIWGRALEASDSLYTTELGKYLSTDTQPYRIALNLASLPVMRGLVRGTITAEDRRKMCGDVLAIAELVGVQNRLAFAANNRKATKDFSGLSNECAALLLFLLEDDPTYVPLPSSSRSGSGHFNPTRTHDITILCQWHGAIRGCVPVEVKAAPTPEDVDRYRALMITKTDLTRQYGSIHSLVESIARVFEGTATPDESTKVEKTKRRLITKRDMYEQQKSVPSKRRERSPRKAEHFTKHQHRRLGRRAAA